MVEHAEELKSARNSATKTDRGLIQKSVTFKLFLRDIGSSPSKIDEFFNDYLEEQVNKKKSKGMSGLAVLSKYKQCFVNCVKRMLDS